MTKKICLVTSTLGQGGVGRNMVNLANGLCELGYTVSLFLMKDCEEQRLSELSNSVKIIVGNRKSRLSIYKLRNHLVTTRQDIVISGPSYINVLVLISAMFIPDRPRIIVTYRSHRSSELANQSLRFKLIEKFTFPLYKRSDFIVGVSKGVADDLRKTLKGFEAKIVTIYNPAWTSLHENQLLESVWHKWFDLEWNSFLKLISVGRLEKPKDFYCLLDAFKLVVDERPSKLLILGEGSLREKLIDYSIEIGVSEHVDFLGHVSNPVTFIQKCDLFVLSSKWEGFANVLVEALGAGVNVVSTDCQSGPSEILDFGRYGALTPVSSYKELANTILSSAENKIDAYELRKRAKHFSSQNSCLEYEKLFFRKL